MFSGAFEHTVDDKCRTVIPAKIRAQISDKFVFTRGLDNCLWLFPLATWNKIQESLTPKSLLDRKSIKLERYFLGAASETEADKQGRVSIPPMLMEHAQIKIGDRLWIVGLTDRVEIWQREQWDSYNQALGKELLDTANDEGAMVTVDNKVA